MCENCPKVKTNIFCVEKVIATGKIGDAFVGQTKNNQIIFMPVPKFYHLINEKGEEIPR